jgi:glycosyltransferase involved in cell wall biosynthesis
MRVAMIYPSRESEKAISGYSSTLTENIKKARINIDSFTYIAGNPKSLFKKFKEFKKYDLIHLQHEYNLLGWYGLPFFVLYLLFFLSGCKVITTMHTVLSQKEKFKGNKIKIFLRKILYLTQNRWINWFSDIVVVHTGFLKETLSDEYGMRKNKVFVFSQGILENVPKYNKQKIKKELKLSGPVYLLTGSMLPDHGHDIIIRQANKIGKTILVVANPGSVNDRNSARIKKYIENNKKIVREKHFEKFVRFDISKDITDKNPLWWKYFAVADLVLLSYRIGHGSGIFAHAMAAERPVIATNVKFFKEISKNFGCVAVAEENRDFPAVIKNAMKPKNYKKMIKECKKYLRENSLSSVGKKYKEIYSNLFK